MPGQRGDRDFHKGKERQAAERVVQFVVAGHIKHTVVGVLPYHPPQVAPFSSML